MPDPRVQLLARDLRARAEEIWSRAETFHDAEARQKLREIAASYEKWARQLEQLASDENEV